MNNARRKSTRFGGKKVLAAWPLAFRNRWKVVRRWIGRDAGLTPRAREIHAALNAAIRRRRSA
jgi:hypothetical protein